MRLLVLVLVLLAAGCVSRQGAEPESTSASEATTATTYKDDLPSISPEDAADGTDYASCADGTCEVYVTGEAVIPLDPSLGFTEFRVAHSPGTLDIVCVDPDDGHIRTDLEGTGQLSVEGVTMDIIVADDTGAVLAFAPR